MDTIAFWEEPETDEAQSGYHQWQLVSTNDNKMPSLATHITPSN
jgi:hypothetical protein